MRVEAARPNQQCAQRAATVISELRVKQQHVQLGARVDRLEHAAPGLLETLLARLKPVVKLNIVGKRTGKLDQAFVAYEGKYDRRICIEWRIERFELSQIAFPVFCTPASDQRTATFEL